MSKFLELVQRRQSVRNYDPLRPVERSRIERCLEAARLAPSACNSQPWRFVVVDEPAVKTVLAHAAFSGIHAMNKFAGEAPILIVAIRELSKFAARVGGWVRSLDYSLIDLGIACEHLVLQAAEEGLGTCWLGWFDERAVRRTLGLPRGTKIDIIISLGYSADETMRTKNRKAPIETWSFFTPPQP